ncbi:isopenicillin N synthase family dioxygenase [Flavisphingomonas formosensis]|uniref:isopenicillin N synthase family dioxygenase n=1 Tax=Flavisphingomonas formosensis TaxID=861534 RepID=UPI0012FB4A79|nr:2-oxoglutarate and iron-dependent oxygenase domain-containing protein [Sphingomonas formosensis]
MVTDQVKDDDRQIAEAIAVSEVPLIDFAPFLNGGASERQAVAEQIARACETIGFFYLTGHGVPPELRGAVFDRSAEFFHLPMAEKEKVRVTDEWNRGWIYSGNPEKLDANSRVFEQYRIQREFDPDDPDLKTGNVFFQPNRWPPQVDGFDRDCMTYYDAMARLSAELLHAFALGLGLPEDRFDRYFQKSVSQISLMYYPPLPEGAGNEIKNLSAHADEGPVVILAQGEIGGLELKTVDGRWLAAPPVPGAYTVNIGNMMMWWSNGRYKSTLHRVRNTSAQERFSIPFFWNADQDVVVEPLPELVERDGQANFPPVHVAALLSRFYKSSVYIPFEDKDAKPA